MKSITSKISAIVLATMISAMVLLFVCPMGMVASDGFAAAANHSSCEGASAEAGGYSLSKFNALGNCMSIRLAMVGQTLRNLISTAGSFYLVAVLSVLALNFFTRRLMTIATDYIFVRLRYQFLRYRSAIKFLAENKLRQFLILLGNYTTVSIG